MALREVPTDIKLGGKGYNIDRSTYRELGPGTRLLERQSYQAATGELDFAPTWPYHQRSWILGEQQYHTHEYDELRTTAIRRYQEGHGLDASVEGQLSLLPAVARSLALTNNPTSCPLISSYNGQSVYAFPAGEVKMYTYTAGAWDAGATVTGATAPITDAYAAGNGEIYVVDSYASGSRVLKRTTGGAWSRLSPPATSFSTYGNEGVTAQGLGNGVTFLGKRSLDQDSVIDGVVAYLTTSATAGTAKAKAVIYEDDGGRPGSLLGTSAEVTETATVSSRTKYTFAFSTAVSVSAGAVWIGLIGGTSGGRSFSYYNAESPGDRQSTYTGGTYATPEATWPSTALYYFDSLIDLYVTASYYASGFSSSAYDDANAVVWVNGELYVVTDGEVYDHSLGEQVSGYCGGEIACTHDGALYWSDGSNKVYEYNGIGTREIIGQLPPGFQVQSLFSAHSRMWICGQLQNGDAAVYWFGQGQYGILAHFPRASGSTRSIKAGAATDEYVLFADSRYGGSLRHYVPEGGWSHYLAYGSAQTIPYKGLVTGAGKTFIVLATGAAGTQGIYCDQTTYVASGQLTSSQMDLQMPAHEKRSVSLTLTSLPLAAGQKILVEVSKDGGTTWDEIGYMKDLNETLKVFPIDYKSPTLQYRLTIYSGTSAATTPTLLSVTHRAIPVVEQGTQWIFTVKDVPMSPSVSGRSIPRSGSAVKGLIADIKASKVLDFVDLWQDTYRVMARYERKLAYERDRPGSLLDVVLQEVQES